MEVRWTSPAAQDLQHIARRIRRDNPVAAQRVAKALYDGCMGLDMFPSRGRVGRIAGTRELVFVPLPYIAVYHSAQDWP
jgi:plasmid stabilization system protein ParE